MGDESGHDLGREPSFGRAVSWTFGCLVGAAAIVGTLVLVLLVTLALQPPAWVQVAVGVGLVAGGALLAWLVASALDRSRFRRASGRRPPGRGPGA